MQKLIISILVWGLFLNLPAFAQTKKPVKAIVKPVAACSLTLDKAPVLRGFYLGQTYQEISRTVPGFAKAYDESGSDYFGLPEADFRITHLTSLETYDELSKQENYQDVTITWQFNEGKLVRLFVTYTEFQPGSLRNFMQQISEKTNIPFESFKVTDKHKALMTCNGFTVELFEGEYTRLGWFPNGSQIILEDTNAITSLERRSKEYETKKKAELIRRKEEEKKRKTILKP